MTDRTPLPRLTATRPTNVSRRGFLAAGGALVLGISLPVARPRAAATAAAAKPGTRVAAFLEIRPDSTVLFRSPFIEGGQGIYTALAQIVGEELDLEPARFTVESAPPGADYLLIGGNRFTGGSLSVRMSYVTMRTLGATARHMLIDAAAQELGVARDTLSTEPGVVVHAATGRKVPYGQLAATAAGLKAPDTVALRDPSRFRYIGKPVPRLDVRAKSTGQATYAIDTKLDGMLLAAVRHSPRLGGEPGPITNEAAVKAMPGVHSIHRLPGAVAVCADSWWRAHQAVAALELTWTEAADGTKGAMPASFSSQAHKQHLVTRTGSGQEAEAHGDAAAALASASKVIEATYDAPHLAHGQLEPSSATARWNSDGTLDLWAPNQAPEMFQATAAKVAGLTPDKVIIHSPVLGGFFGRHFLYMSANPFPQAILLAKATGRPVKLIWSREEEFLRDAVRPMAAARFRAGLDANGWPIALDAVAINEGPVGRWFGRAPNRVDSSAVEGISGKPYAIANRRVGHIHVDDPAVIGFWRSVGHSMNDYFFETFFDEMAMAGGHDPYELRLRLLTHSPRHATLLKAVADLSGGWRRGPYRAEDGSVRARGVAMASPFGSEVATIAETSIGEGDVNVHAVWVAIDPGQIVNPAIVEAQVQSAVALGVSAALLEDVVYENGMPRARNFDGYPILPPSRMPKVHVRIVESGAPMGGIGEPGLPGVAPAIANAVAALNGQRLRSLPFSATKLEPVRG
jgi:isoquinoline 1-oxidoreductase subunit beta